MPTRIPTILDQISAEKTKVGERLARLNADREKIATQLTDLETAERVLSRVSTTPSARRLRSASATEGKALVAKQSRGRQPRAATSKSVGREPGARTPSLGERVLALQPAKPDKNYTRHVPAIVRTMSALRYSAISARAGSRSARGKLYAIPTAAE